MANRILRRKRKPLVFATLPDWALDTACRTRYSIAAAFGLCGLTGLYVRLTAESQRKLFGSVLFGKCEIRVTNWGIDASRSAAFGTDRSQTFFNWDEVETYIASGRRPVI